MQFEVAALNGQLDWVRLHYPRDAFISLDGLPLLLIMDGGLTHPKLPDKINAPGWALRWMGAALDIQPELVAAGYWSWMDEVNPPVVTRRNGTAESATLSIGCFRFPNPHWFVIFNLGLSTTSSSSAFGRDERHS